MHRSPSLLGRLLEKGRAISTVNETKIKSAMDLLKEVLNAIRDGKPITEALRSQFREAGVTLLEAELSYDQRRQTVNTALRTAKKDNLLGHSGGYCYIQEMYDTWLVYMCYDSQGDGDTLYKVSYVIDESTGVVTFGKPVAVIAHMVYEPVTSVLESGRPAVSSDPPVRLVESVCVPLVEKAVAKDGSVNIKIVGPGWGSSGYYSAAVLERDGPSVFPKGTHMYWNHPTLSEMVERPERSLTDLAAVLESDARWDADGAEGPGLYATAGVKQAYSTSVEQLAPDIGVSLNTSGRVRMGDAEGRSGPIVEALMADPLTSVDFVTRAGAGGKIQQLFEAARAVPTGTAVPPHPQEAPMALTAQEEQALRESQTTLQQDNARLREALLLRDARDIATTHLATKSDLLEATRTRIASNLARQISDLPLTAEKALDRTAYIARIDEAVTAEQQYLTSLGVGEIRGMGGSGGAGGTGGTGATDITASEALLQAALVDIGLSESTAKLAVAGRS